MARKYSFAEVKQTFAEAGYALLSDEYERSTQKLLCRCPKGHEYAVEFRNFKSGKRCRRCSYDLQKTNTHFKSKEFLEQREKTCLKRYGVKSIQQAPEIRKKTETTNLKRYGSGNLFKTDTFKERSKNTCLIKYGTERASQSPEVHSRVRKTLRERYGIDWITERSSQVSKESQKLFWDVHNRLPSDISHKDHFGDFNGEFCIRTDGFTFKYDFVNSTNKKCIEYNGSRFHPPPELPDDATGWFPFDLKKTAATSRKYDDRKHKAIMARGYSILIVWDTEFKSDRDGTIARCVGFVLN